MTVYKKNTVFRKKSIWGINIVLLQKAGFLIIPFKIGTSELKYLVLFRREYYPERKKQDFQLNCFTCISFFRARPHNRILLHFLNSAVQGVYH